MPAGEAPAEAPAEPPEEESEEADIPEEPEDPARPGAPEIPEALAEPKSDPECWTWLEDGKQALKDERFLEAIETLAIVIEECSGAARDEAELALSEAKAERSRRISQLLKQARQATDLEKQAEAYRKVLDLNPKNKEAQASLSRIAREREGAKERDWLTTVKRNLRRPHIVLSELEKHLRDAQELIADGMADEELGDLYEQGRARRANLLVEVGRIETARADRDYHGAIERLERMAAAGELELYDDDRGEYVRIHEKLGFRVLGMRERLGKLDGRWRDVLLLERRSKSVGLD